MNCVSALLSCQHHHSTATFTAPSATGPLPASRFTTTPTCNCLRPGGLTACITTTSPGSSAQGFLQYSPNLFSSRRTEASVRYDRHPSMNRTSPAGSGFYRKVGIGSEYMRGENPTSRIWPYSCLNAGQIVQQCTSLSKYKYLTCQAMQVSLSSVLLSAHNND